VNGAARGERWYLHQDGTAVRCRSMTAALRKRAGDRPIFVMVLRAVAVKPEGETPLAAAADYADLLTAVDDCREHLLGTRSANDPNSGSATSKSDAATRTGTIAPCAAPQDADGVNG